MKRLIEQTACEHGEFGECLGYVANKSGFKVLPCPGGSSREVTVDELAALIWAHQETPSWPRAVETAESVAGGW